MSEPRTRQDEAARAGWLYYIAGKTQDDIARTLNVSRPSVQRLVSLCRAEGLITFRVNHPISECMRLAAELAERHGLGHCDVVPAGADAASAFAAVTEAAAVVLERMLRKDEPSIVGIGTGRALRATALRVTPMSRPLHRLVALAGNIVHDGAASPYNALEKLADASGAQAFPMPLPMLAADAAQREILHGIDCVRRVLRMADEADVWLAGLSAFDEEASLYRDGFVTRDELLDLMRHGGVGATRGWAFDARGALLDHPLNHRVTSPRPGPSGKPRLCVTHGRHKARALQAALAGGLFNGLITDEITARAVLAEGRTP